MKKRYIRLLYLSLILLTTFIPAFSKTETHAVDCDDGTDIIIFVLDYESEKIKY